MQTALFTGERTGWRDEALSARHRRWGFNCPGVDLDFVMLEYHLAQPVAIVEYKHHRAAWPDFNHPTYRALCGLANRTPVLPLFVARYWPETWSFSVLGVNARARAAIGDENEAPMSEQQYVRFLHLLRMATVQENVLVGLHTELPPPRLSLVK